MKKHRLPVSSDETHAKRKLIILFLLILFCAGSVYFVGKAIDSIGKQSEPRGDLSTRYTEVPAIEYSGARYQPKTELTTLLVIGTDHYSDRTESSSSFRNGGQADFLLVLVIDDKAETITTLQIDRDTMAEITTLGVLGNETGTRLAQICLAHGFGDGGEQSCQLQTEAVSRFLLGMDIPYYIAVNLDGIAALNDAVGGVTVMVNDDFSLLDPSMVKGQTITLHGVQAEYFVRSRKNINVGTNESRMVRQQEYWNALCMQILQQINSDGDTDFLDSLFEIMDPYMTTNLKRGRIINEVWKDKDYERSAIIHPVGEYSTGTDGFVEFHADESALEQLVIQTFYNKVS